MKFLFLYGLIGFCAANTLCALTQFGLFFWLTAATAAVGLTGAVVIGDYHAWKKRQSK